MLAATLPSWQSLRARLLPCCSWVCRAAQHLAWPPLQHGDLAFRKRVTLVVIHVHDRLSGHPAGPHERFNLATLKDTLQSGLGHLQVRAQRSESVHQLGLGEGAR